MEELESIASSFQGVEQAFAIQAGREVRVLVKADQTNDESAAKNNPVFGLLLLTKKVLVMVVSWRTWDTTIHALNQQPLE